MPPPTEEEMVNYCVSCAVLLHGLHVVCTECHELARPLGFCLECFAFGVELRKHSNRHAYKLLNADRAIFTSRSTERSEPAWPIAAELQLLDAVERYNMGWQVIAEKCNATAAPATAAGGAIKKSLPSDPRRHYERHFLNGPMATVLLSKLPPALGVIDVDGLVLDGSGGVKVPPGALGVMAGGTEEEQEEDKMDTLEVSGVVETESIASCNPPSFSVENSVKKEDDEDGIHPKRQISLEESPNHSSSQSSSAATLDKSSSSAVALAASASGNNCAAPAWTNFVGVKGYKLMDLGWMPLRGDFELEWSDGAEEGFNQLLPLATDEAGERALLSARSACYARILAERERRKRVIENHGLVQQFFLRKLLKRRPIRTIFRAEKSTLTELGLKDLVEKHCIDQSELEQILASSKAEMDNKWNGRAKIMPFSRIKKFRQFLNYSETVGLCREVHEIQLLQRRIWQLKQWKRNGVLTVPDGVAFNHRKQCQNMKSYFLAFLKRDNRIPDDLIDSLDKNNSKNSGNLSASQSSLTVPIVNPNEKPLLLSTVEQRFCDEAKLGSADYLAIKLAVLCHRAMARQGIPIVMPRQKCPPLVHVQQQQPGDGNAEASEIGKTDWSSLEGYLTIKDFLEDIGMI